MKRRLCLLLVLALLLCGCTQKTSTMYSVKFYDAETTLLITEVQMAEGDLLQVPEVAIKEGCSVDGLYMTSTLAGKYPENTTVTGNMTVFITWKTAGQSTEPTQAPTHSPTQTPTEPTQAPTEEPTTGNVEPQYHVLLNGAYHTEIVDGAFTVVPMTHLSDREVWYEELPSLPKGTEVSVFDEANKVTVASVKSGSAGNYILTLRFVDGEPELKLEKLAYYVVGTCGNGRWEEDVTSTNYTYQMINAGGTITLDMNFTQEDTSEDGMVHFRVAYGGAGIALKWYTKDGGDFIVPPGTHSVTLNGDLVTMG